MRYITSRAVILQIGAIERRAIDAFVQNHCPPKPPTKTVTVFGGTEEVDDFGDEDYQRSLFAYYIGLFVDQFDLLEPAIEIEGEWWNDERFTELREAGAISTTLPPIRQKHEYLQFVALSEDDMQAIVEEVFYQSTVTQRGIDEAESLFNVTWFDKSVYAWAVKSTPGKFSQIFEDRNAAMMAHYKWREFCELPGPEQSAIVAHHRLKLRLEHLASRIESNG